MFDGLLSVDDPDVFVDTRDALHRVAEHILAKTRYVDDGEIRLMAFAGGFATPLLTNETRVRVDVVDLVVDDPLGSRRTPLTTIADGAAFVGVEPGFPSDLYPPATRLDVNEPLNLDRSSAETLAAWYGFTAGMLDMFAAEIAEANPSRLILWPEHFDQAFFTEDVDESRRANYGASPGDDGHPEPYLYVGPWGPVAINEFWNAPHFNGAVLSLSTLNGATNPADATLMFLRTGRALLTAR
jgi:hypothetical protein